MSDSPEEKVPVKLMVDDSGEIIYVVSGKPNKSDNSAENKKTVPGEDDTEIIEDTCTKENEGINAVSEEPQDQPSDKTEEVVKSSIAEVEANAAQETSNDSEQVLSNPPITVSEETVVIVDGQKCVLKVNPDTGLLSAYPVKDNVPGNGQAVELVSNSPQTLVTSSVQNVNVAQIGEKDMVDLDSSAAQGLLELSNAGPDSRQEDISLHNSDTYPRIRQIKQSAISTNPNTPLPRFIIPSPGGHTTMMAIMQRKGISQQASVSMLDTGNKPTEQGDAAGNACNTADNLTDKTPLTIPPSLAPFVLPKKTPVKIGLKTSNEDLAKFKCPKCEFQGYYEKQYQDHIAGHTEDVQKCKCCAFLTFGDQGMVQHFKVMHPKNICSICDQTAEHAYIIKRHELRHNTKGCECDICGKIYKDRYILKMHVKLVHMPAEVLYACHICQKKFTRKAHLKRHTRIHEPEKPFKCPHCEYRGCERSDISKHILIHEEPKHSCEVCGKTFRHFKNKELHVKRHKGQRDYKCGVCDFYGYTFTDIRKHIERKHSEIKTYPCDRCPMHFKTELAHREHRQHCTSVFNLEQTFTTSSQDGLEPSRLEGHYGTTIEMESSQGSESVSGEVQQLVIDSNQFMQVTVADDGEINLAESHIVTSMAEVTDTVGHGISTTEHDSIHLIQDGSMDINQSENATVTLEIPQGDGTIVSEIVDNGEQEISDTDITGINI